MTGNNFVLWQDDTFQIKTPFNPHQSYADGPHLIVAPLHELRAAWDDPTLAAKGFELAARACKIMEDIQFTDWYNIQANANWGLLPDQHPFFHVHIYGRSKTAERWAKPLILPELPKTYKNDPMPEADRERLTEAFKTL